MAPQNVDVALTAYTVDDPITAEVEGGVGLPPDLSGGEKPPESTMNTGTIAPEALEPTAIPPSNVNEEGQEAILHPDASAPLLAMPAVRVTATMDGDDAEPHHEIDEQAVPQIAPIGGELAATPYTGEPEYVALESAASSIHGTDVPFESAQNLPAETIAAPEQANAEAGHQQDKSITQYRPSSGRSYPRSPRRITSAAAQPLRLFVRAVFEKDGFLRITLLPRRDPDMPEQVVAMHAEKRFDITGVGQDWYGDVLPTDLGRSLHDGMVLIGAAAQAKWILTRRDIYVLSSQPQLTGYISGPRLVLGKKHIVLCREERLSETLALIAATQSPAPRQLDASYGVPHGWIALADVVPAEAFAFVQGAGILNILRPSLRIEIALEGGVRLERSTWLDGCPPIF